MSRGGTGRFVCGSHFTPLGASRETTLLRRLFEPVVVVNGVPPWTPGHYQRPKRSIGRTEHDK